MCNQRTERSNVGRTRWILFASHKTKKTKQNRNQIQELWNDKQLPKKKGSANENSLLGVVEKQQENGYKYSFIKAFSTTPGIVHLYNRVVSMGCSIACCACLAVSLPFLSLCTHATAQSKKVDRNNASRGEQGYSSYSH